MFTPEQQKSLQLLDKLLSDENFIAEAQKEVDKIDSFKNTSSISASEYFDYFYSQFYFHSADEEIERNIPISKFIVKNDQNLHQNYLENKGVFIQKNRPKKDGHIVYLKIKEPKNTSLKPFKVNKKRQST